MTQRLYGVFLVGFGLLALSASAFAQGPVQQHTARKSSGTRLKGNPITHIVVIVQENRTVDNLFQGFNSAYPGAGLDVQDHGSNSHGRQQFLQQVSFKGSFDPTHAHANWLAEYNGGQMNGWDRERFVCHHHCATATAFGYVPSSETVPYFKLAHNFAIADHVLQANQGPSFEAHQYLIAGQAGGFTSGYSERDNPKTHGKDKLGTGGCDVPGATVRTINVQTGKRGKKIFPCENYSPYTTILQEMDALYPDAHNWRYYTPSLANIWNAPFGVQDVYSNLSDRAKDVVPETGILDAVNSHTLAKLSYVVPCKDNSDHARSGSADGPLWVASVTNAIGESSYWNSTAIIVIWDDWGGWFDHYKPTIRNQYEYGFRVPMLVISPWVKQAALVDHTVRNSASVLSFIENTFKLSSLQTDDQYSDDLGDMFDFGPGHQLLPYTPIDTGGFNPYACNKRHGHEPIDE